MSVSRTVFNNAIREATSSEFSFIPENEDEIEHAFSEKFIKRMEKLITARRKSYWFLINTVSKRVALIILSILTIGVAAFSVKGIREPVLNFIKEYFSTHMHYSYDGDLTDTITREYIISAIPEGFEQIQKTVSDPAITTIYKNAADDTIEFSQLTTKYSTGFFIDREHGEHYTKELDGTEIEIHDFEITKTVLWSKDGYVFCITCYGDVSVESIFEMILSIT